MAGELIVVESNIIIAGGTITAALPALVRKFRRSGETPSGGRSFSFFICEAPSQKKPPSAVPITNFGQDEMFPSIRGYGKYIDWRQLTAELPGPRG